MTKPDPQSESSGIRTAAILIAVVAVLYLARELLIPLAFAITLTLVLAPAVGWIQKLRLSRVPAVLVVMIVLIAGACGIGWVIFGQLIAVINELPSYQANIQRKIEAMRSTGNGPVGHLVDSVKQLSGALSASQAAPPTPNRRNPQNTPGSPLPVQVVEPPTSEFQYVRELTQPFLGPLGTFGVVLIFTLFLLIEQTDLRDRLFRLAGLGRMNVMTKALDDATQRVSRYLMLLLLVNISFGILCGAGLKLIGVHYAVLCGTVAAILRIVPYVGSPIAFLLPFALSLALDSWIYPVLVLLLFGTLELVTANLIEPFLYGAHTGISSLALLLTTVFWAVLWGPAGLILATPLTVCVVVLGLHVPQLSFLHTLLGDEPVLEPQAQIYQRLLAMDDHEARAVATAYLDDHSLAQLYDAAIIPVLGMAEQDRHKGALSPTREEFVFLSIREMLAECSEKTQNAEPRNSTSPAHPGRALCLAASDEADEIAAAMLAQLLEQAGHTAVSLPNDASAEHMVGILDPSETDVFCISTVPPFAFSRARTLSRQLQVRFPRTPVMVGVWGFLGDAERALQRFQPAHPDRLVTNLADAVEFVLQRDTIRDAVPEQEGL